LRTAFQFRNGILILTIVAGGVDTDLNAGDRRNFAGRDIMVRTFLFFSILLSTGAVAAPLFVAHPDTHAAVDGAPRGWPAAMTQSQRNDVTQVAAEGAVPEPGETFRDCPDCPEMVVVPAGEFDMGGKENPFEAPPHRVTIAKPYAIQRREVNFDEWDACADAGACKNRPSDHGWGRGKQPVIDVSWEDAEQFVGWLSQKTGRKYRLPSEAEWEFAAVAVLVGTRRWQGQCQLRQLRRGFTAQDGTYRIVSAQRFRSLRHRGKCLRMGRRLLERQLRQGAQGWLGLDYRAVPSAGVARRFICQQGQCGNLCRALSVRHRRPLLRQRFSPGAGSSVGRTWVRRVTWRRPCCLEPPDRGP
jgi:hypothetical protein